MHIHIRTITQTKEKHVRTYVHTSVAAIFSHTKGEFILDILSMTLQ